MTRVKGHSPNEDERIPAPAISTQLPAARANVEDQPLAISIERFCELTSLRKTLAFKLIRENKIEARRIGRRTVILMSSVHALLAI